MTHKATSTVCTRNRTIRFIPYPCASIRDRYLKQSVRVIWSTATSYVYIVCSRRPNAATTIIRLPFFIFFHADTVTPFSPGVIEPLRRRRRRIPSHFYARPTLTSIRPAGAIKSHYFRPTRLSQHLSVYYTRIIIIIITVIHAANIVVNDNDDYEDDCRSKRAYIIQLFHRSLYTRLSHLFYRVLYILYAALSSPRVG